jgi:hypothetical protein
MRQVVIKMAEGLCYIESPRGGATGISPESTAGKILPDAPPEYVAHFGQIVESLLGPTGHIQVVEGVADTETHR